MKNSLLIPLLCGALSSAAMHASEPMDVYTCSTLENRDAAIELAYGLTETGEEVIYFDDEPYSFGTLLDGLKWEREIRPDGSVHVIGTYNEDRAENTYEFTLPSPLTGASIAGFSIVVTHKPPPGSNAPIEKLVYSCALPKNVLAERERASEKSRLAALEEKVERLERQYAVLENRLGRALK